MFFFHRKVIIFYIAKQLFSVFLKIVKMSANIVGREKKSFDSIFFVYSTISVAEQKSLLLVFFKDEKMYTKDLVFPTVYEWVVGSADNGRKRFSFGLCGMTYREKKKKVTRRAHKTTPQNKVFASLARGERGEGAKE